MSKLALFFSHAHKTLKRARSRSLPKNEGKTLSAVHEANDRHVALVKQGQLACFKVLPHVTSETAIGVATRNTKLVETLERLGAVELSQERRREIGCCLCLVAVKLPVRIDGRDTNEKDPSLFLFLALLFLLTLHRSRHFVFLS